MACKNVVAAATIFLVLSLISLSDVEGVSWPPCRPFLRSRLGSCDGGDRKDCKDVCLLAGYLGGICDAKDVCYCIQNCPSDDRVTGWHVFKVQGYSKYKAAAAGVGMAVTSGEFVVGGHSWRIQYFPCGCDRWHHSCCVCFCLQHQHAVSPVVAAQFELRLLLDEDGAPLPAKTLRRVSGPGLYDYSTPHTQGFHSLVRNDTFDSLYVEADCFSVRCDVTVFLQETRDGSTQPSPDLERQLGKMLDSGVGADVTFQVDGEEFVAHKSVLAVRSPVFMAEFFGGMTIEVKQGASSVQVPGIDARVFKALLNFIYTDSLPEIDDEDDKIFMAQHLLVAADRYGIERLKSTCEKKLQLC